MIGPTSRLSPSAFRRIALPFFATLGLASVLALATAADAHAAEAGWVAQINGNPSITRAGKTEMLHRGDTVAIGDLIETDESAKAKLLLADDSVLTLGPRTRVIIDELLLGGEDRKGRIRVLLGRFKVAVAAWLNGPSTFEVATPTAVAGVRGTVLWGDTVLDAICALEGTVEVRTVQGDATAKLDAGACVTDMARGETVRMSPSKEDLAKYLKEVTLD